MSLQVTEIIDAIEAAQEKSVIIEWNPLSPSDKGPREAPMQAWSLTIANNPEKYFDILNRKFARKATNSFKFKLDSIEHGIELARSLFKYYNLEEDEIVVAPEVRSDVELFLAIHIHYELN